VGGDKGFDTKDFVAECRNLNVTPHVAQNLNRNGGSAIDGRTTRIRRLRDQPTTAEARRRVLRVAENVALVRKVRQSRDREGRVAIHLAAAAYNLVRMRNLLALPVGAA